MTGATPAETSLPRRRAGHTTAVTIGGEQFYLTANAAADGSLAEVFIQWGKHGSGPAGLMDLYASALSMALRRRVPLADLIRSGLGLRFAPAGRTDDPDIPSAHSVADYVARRLAIDWLPAEGAGHAPPRLAPTGARAATGSTAAAGARAADGARAAAGPGAPARLVEQRPDVVGVQG